MNYFAWSIEKSNHIWIEQSHHFNNPLRLHDKTFSFSKFVIQFYLSLFDNFKSEFSFSIQSNSKIQFFTTKSKIFHRPNENFAKKKLFSDQIPFSLFNNRIFDWFESLFRINKRKSLNIRMEILHVKTKFILNFNQLNIQKVLYGIKIFFLISMKRTKTKFRSLL